MSIKKIEEFNNDLILEDYNNDNNLYDTIYEISKIVNIFSQEANACCKRLNCSANA